MKTISFNVQRILLYEFHKKSQPPNLETDSAENKTTKNSLKLFATINSVSHDLM